MTSDTQHSSPTDDLDGTLLVEEPRFAIVPEWVIDAAVTDAAFRLYSLLLRYGNGSGCRMPSRATLARRLRRSVDAVDRAMRQLSEAGIVRIEHRRCEEQFLSNRYHVRTSQAPPTPVAGGGRIVTATREPGREGGRTSAATPGRTSAARVAVDVRPDREISTESTPPPPPSPAVRRPAGTAVEEADRQLLDFCGITDLPALAERCAASRRALGKPTTRWTPRCLAVVIRLAVVGKGWPAATVADALQTIARDPETRSPARVAEAGPWWDVTVLGSDLRLEAAELAELEWRLSETGGLRPLLQAQARRKLADEGLPVTRHTVARRAAALLEARAADTRTPPEAETSSTSAPQTLEGIAR